MDADFGQRAPGLPPCGAFTRCLPSPADSLASGRRLKCLTVVDDFSRECVDIAVDHSMGAHAVTDDGRTFSVLLYAGEPRHQVAGEAHEGRRMSQIIRLTQGTPEWLAHRQLHRNASETAAVLGLSPWLTPYQLWLQRTRRATQEVTPAMQRGTELEAAARDAYEAETGHIMEPLVMTSGDYSASLDGITLDGHLALEIKCPMRGRESSLWQAVSGGTVPVHYYWQIQHQLMVSQAESIHLYVFDGSKGLLLQQKPEPECWDTIKHGWDAFMACVKSDRPPALMAGDTLTRSDEPWREAAETLIRLKQAAELASVAADEAKAQLIALASHTSECGHGVSVTRFWKQGSVDYKRVPGIGGVDLDAYRGKAREEVRVTISKPSEM